MKSLNALWSRIALELAIQCRTSTIRDIQTVTERSSNEGDSFFTITLPSFCRDFERSLDIGKVDHTMFLSFKKRGGLPLFLGGFLDLIFDRDSGHIVDKPSITAIRAVRQLTLLYSKMFLPCSARRERAALSAFVDCEHEVNVLKISDKNLFDFRRFSRELFGPYFSEVDDDVYSERLVPKHGPGATADGLRGNAKYRIRLWPERLCRSFSPESYALPNPRYFEALEAIDFVEPGSEIPIKVISVPKTQKTPRLIGIEPTAMQYAQQAVSRSLYDRLSSYHELNTMIGFNDQRPNQMLAELGSYFGNLATLDLSEASDRVSYSLVRCLFSDHPHLQNAVDDCRSRYASVPGHGIIPLAKFAPMGSALCFPIEAFTFLTCVFIGIDRALMRPVSPRELISEFYGEVRVYGDDIIVPVECVRSVVDVLEEFGFKVNHSKSFWNGKFRESCGKEYFDGFDVSIVKVRQVFPSRRTDVTEVISLVSLRNQLFEAGFFETCEWIDGLIRKILPYFPVVLPSSSVLGRHEFDLYEVERYDDQLQIPLVRGFVPDSKLPVNAIDSEAALLKVFLQMEAKLPFGLETVMNPPTHDAEHLERSGRPQSASMKLRWCQPY